MTKDTNLNPELFTAPTELLKEIGEAETTQHYIALKEQIAKIEYALNQSTGWFWKRSAVNDVERAKLQANLDVCNLALAQVVDSIHNENPKSKQFIAGCNINIGMK